MERLLEIEVTATALPVSPTTQTLVHSLEDFDWILFTSSYAVTLFSALLDQEHVRIPRVPQIAAVGKKTTSTLEAAGFSVHLIPSTPTVTTLINELPDIVGARILFPRSALAPHSSITALEARGAIVTPLVLYTVHGQPLSIQEKIAVLSGIYTTLRFKSPSGVTGFMNQLTPAEQQTVQTLRAQCIGPTTAAAATNLGFTNIEIEHPAQT